MATAIQSKSEAGTLDLSRVRLPLPLRFRPDRPWTDEDLLAFSAANDPLQIERESDGTIVMMTPAGGMGNVREQEVATELTIWARSDGRGQAFGYNAGFILPDGALLSPDAAWVPSERWLNLTSAQREKYLQFCPSFVIEVLSASDSLSQAEEKMRQWVRNGAELGWLIDPYTAAVSVFRPSRDMERIDRPEMMQGEGCVAGFALQMERLWA